MSNEQSIVLYQEVERVRPLWLVFTAGIPGVITLALALGVAAYVALPPFVMRLFFWLTPDAVWVKYTPFHLTPRRFPWAEVASARVRQYDPIGEYRGWGIKAVPHGMAYSVDGEHRSFRPRADPGDPETRPATGATDGQRFTAASVRRRCPATSLDIPEFRRCKCLDVAWQAHRRPRGPKGATSGTVPVWLQKPT